jgi:hypothetical protein
MFASFVNRFIILGLRGIVGEVARYHAVVAVFRLVPVRASLRLRLAQEERDLEAIARLKARILGK